jgi:hypothetical protein
MESADIHSNLANWQIAGVRCCATKKVVFLFYRHLENNGTARED